MPLISVIVPVYNAEQYLEKCIESLLAQSFDIWEAILVDDGSKDGSGQLCDAYAEKDSRIRVVHQHNQGVSAARNNGIMHASGSYVAFLDADDQLAPETFSELACYLASEYDVVCWTVKTNDITNPDLSTMSSELTIADGTDEMALYDLNLRTFTGWSLAGKKDRGMHFAVTKLIKRSLILENAIWFDTKLKYHEDTLFSIQIVEAARTLVALNKYYYIRTLHAESATVSFCPGIHEGNKRYLESLKQIIEENHPDDAKYQLAFAKYQLSCFRQCLHLDCMHPVADYSTQERMTRITALLQDSVYLPHVHIQTEGFKFTHKMLYCLVKYKITWAIYLFSKAGLL